MRFKVIVSGVPTRVKLGKLVQMFSLILSMPNSEFLVQLMPSKGLKRDVVISFTTFTDAYLAQEMLDNFIYKEKTVTSVFMATMQHQPANANKQSGQEDGHHQNRSQSPYSPTAAKDLDMRTELLTKQQRVLEEENKLIEEQAKLEKFKMETFVINKAKKPKTKEPCIKGACNDLMKTLTPFVYEHATLQEHRHLVRRLRTVILDRMAAVVAAGHLPFPKLNQVMTMYRAKYLPEEDEEFVKSVLQDVRKYRSTKTSNFNVYEGTPKAAVDHDKEGRATTKDTTFPGDFDDSDSTEDEATEKDEITFEEKKLLIKKTIKINMNNMKIHVIKHSSPKIRKLLAKYVYLTLKQRIESIIADMPKCKPHKIIHHYESIYPRNEDEEFIKKISKDIDEGRVPEEIIKIKQMFDSKTPQERTIQKGIDKSGETGSKEDQDDSVIIINEDSVEDIEEQISESTVEIVSDVSNAKNVNDKMENSSSEKGNDVSENTENEGNVASKEEIKRESTLAIGSNVKNSEKENDNMKVSEKNRGVKRKNDVEENGSVKERKSSSTSSTLC